MTDLTLAQTGGIPVTRVADRQYQIGGITVTVDELAGMIDGFDQAQTQQEQNTLILMALCKGSSFWHEWARWERQKRCLSCLLFPGCSPMMQAKCEGEMLGDCQMDS